jgi:hypothetical protein
MVDHRARREVCDQGHSGVRANRYHWTVALLGKPDPMASERTGEIGEARRAIGYEMRETNRKRLREAFPGNRHRNPALRRWPATRMPDRNGPMPSRSEPQVKHTAKPSKTIRANKRKAKLRAKHRRRRARATGKAVMK